MTELAQAEILRRLTELAGRVDRLAEVVARLEQRIERRAAESEPGATPPWQITSQGAA